MRQRPSLATTRRVWAALSRCPRASVRELSAETGYAYSNIAAALHALREAGYIDYPDRAARARTIIVPFRYIKRRK